MASESGLKAHLRVAFAATFLLALCQMVVETFAIATRYHRFLMSPFEFYHAQLYDYCVKLFVLLPGATHWLQSGPLDRFLADGFKAKLAIAGGLIVPNLVISALVALLVAMVCVALRLRARPRTALAIVATLALAVHLTSYAVMVHIPKGWTAKVVIHNFGRVFVWDGAWIAWGVLLAAAGVSDLLLRLRASMRWAVSLAAAGATAACIIALAPAGPVSWAATGAPVDKAIETRLPRVDNVVLISIDSLRADRLGCYGNQHDTSPTLDRLAREGARFTNTMSTTSWTLPSHMSMLTGRYLLSHGVISETDKLPATVPTLAGSLHRAGISTGGVVSAIWLEPQYGFNRGFDYYDYSSIASNKWYDELSDEPAPTVTKHAIEWLRKQRGKRFFLFVHYWDVHYDYNPPPPYNTMFDPDYHGSVTAVNFMHNKAIHRGMPRRDFEHVLALYDGEIRWVDDHIQQIVATLDQMGVSNRTAVIVTADHGDEFFEHGGKGHQRTLYREVVHVPLIMRVPGVKPGQVVQTPVSLVDVTPTILSLMGVSIPPGVDGESLLPALVGGSIPPRRFVYGWLCNPQRRTDCEAMEYSHPDTLIDRFQPARVELFDNARDALQHRNLAAKPGWDRRERLDGLTAALNARWRVYRQLGGGRGAVKIDRATMERLRALGYAD